MASPANGRRSVAGDDKLSIPVILGTPRKGRRSIHPARFVLGRLALRDDVTTELIDIAEMHPPVDDAGEQIKDPAFAAKMERADGLVLITPEYNHSFPGLMKHVLDSCLAEYSHKAAGVVGVSAGPFGGTRVIESLLPVMRELGLVTIFEDMNFGTVGKLFDDQGKLLDQSYVRRVDKFLNELIWMSRVLKNGRENVAPI